MRKILFLALLILISGCAKDPDAYYTCYGGVKVDSLEKCDFSNISLSFEECNSQVVYSTGSIITTPDEVLPAFEAYSRTVGGNYTFVRSEYYKMIDGLDYYRFNFFDYESVSRKQFFMDGFGNIYDPVGCPIP